MSMRPGAIVAMAGGLVLGATLASTASQAPPTSPSPGTDAAVDLVAVDAVVVDRDGQSVRGLTAADFTVSEDGVLQSVSSFEAVDAGHSDAPAAAASGPPSARVSTNVGQPRDDLRRTFVLLIDDLHLSPVGLLRAREAVTQFVDRDTLAGDRILIVVPGTGMVWTASMPAGRRGIDAVLAPLSASPVRMAEMSDYEALHVVRGDDPGVLEAVRQRLQMAGMFASDTVFQAMNQQAGGRTLADVHEDQNRFILAEARRVLETARHRWRQTLEVIASTLNDLADLLGRKALVLVSEGFIYDTEERQYHEVVDAARRGNAEIDFLDVHLLASGGSADTGSLGVMSQSSRTARPEDSEGAELLATETGGTVIRRTNDPGQGLARLAQESSAYYLLGYVSTNTARDGAFRKIRVDVRRTDVVVRARPGYFARRRKREDPEIARTGVSARVERELRSPVSATQIPLRLTAFELQPVGDQRVHVTLASEVGASGMALTPAAGGLLSATLDVAMAVTQAQRPGASQMTPWRKWEVRIPAQARGADIWVPLDVSFDLPPGLCQAKLMVHDRGSGATGSVTHTFEVPKSDVWRVSSPILSDIPAKEPGGRPRLLVSRNFASGAALYCYFEVYEAERDPHSGAPRVSFDYALTDDSGKSWRGERGLQLAANAQGRLGRLLEIPLDGVVPGRYVLALDVQDEVAGHTDQLRETLSVRRPAHPNLGLYLDLVRSFLGGDASRAVAGILQWPTAELRPIALALPPDDGLRRGALMLHTDLAIRLWESGRGAEAEAQLDLARVLLDQQASPTLRRDWLLALGYFLQANARARDALAYFDECARLDPSAAEAWLGAGTVHEYSAFPDGFGGTQLAETSHQAAAAAQRDYREALKADPTLAEAHLRLGRVLSLTGRLDDAEKELEAAAGEGDGRVTALAQLFWGHLREQRQDAAGAMLRYRAALDADPACQPAALALSHLLEQAGRVDEARQCLAGALTAKNDKRRGSWLEYHLGLAPRLGPALDALHQELPALARSEP